MAKNNVKGTATYVQRVLQDDFVQEQLRTILSGLQSSYKRAREQKGRSVEDKKLFASLQQVATSTRNVIRAFARPEPEPTHRGRKLTVVVVAVAATAALTVKMQKLETQRKAGADAPTS